MSKIDDLRALAVSLVDLARACEQLFGALNTLADAVENAEQLADQAERGALCAQ